MRLMLDLALNNTGAPISLKDVARRQEISDKYLEQIISVLNRAGYMRSVRGAQGGYLLRKAPEEYTVGMILRLTEGSLAPVACLDEGDDVNCEKREDCVTLILWKKINDAICSVVDHIAFDHRGTIDHFVLDKRIAFHAAGDFLGLFVNLGAQIIDVRGEFVYLRVAILQLRGQSLPYLLTRIGLQLLHE